MNDRALNNRAQEIVRSAGMCGCISPDGKRICILDPGHEQSHPWDDADDDDLELYDAKRELARLRDGLWRIAELGSDYEYETNALYHAAASIARALLSASQDAEEPA